MNQISINAKNISLKRKQNIYERLTGMSPDAIVLLSGGTIQSHSTRVNEGDSFGILWGEARVIAVAELALCFPQARVIVADPLTSLEATGVSPICRELVELEVTLEKIQVVNTSSNTLSQVRESVKAIQEMKLSKAVFVTNEYHVPRSSALYEYCCPLKYQAKIKFIAAESILPYRDSKYIRIIDEMKETLAYRKRIRNEKTGLLMIKNGEYGKNIASSGDKSERLV